MQLPLSNVCQRKLQYLFFCSALVKQKFYFLIFVENLNLNKKFYQNMAENFSFASSIFINPLAKICYKNIFTPSAVGIFS
jgi:hypothetical protein